MKDKDVPAFNILRYLCSSAFQRFSLVSKTVAECYLGLVLAAS